MNKLMKILTIFVMSTALFACSGDPTFDASSKEAMETSTGVMSKDLSSEQKKKFEMSLAKLAMQVGMEAAQNGARSEADVMKAIGEKLDGLTVDEINALAEK